jgi:hypothetical protein
MNTLFYNYRVLAAIILFLVSMLTFLYSWICGIICVLFFSRILWVEVRDHLKLMRSKSEE